MTLYIQRADRLRGVYDYTAFGGQVYRPAVNLRTITAVESQETADKTIEELQRLDPTGVYYASRKPAKNWRV